MNVHARTFMNVHSRKRTFEIGRHEEPVLYIYTLFNLYIYILRLIHHTVHKNVFFVCISYSKCSFLFLLKKCRKSGVGKEREVCDYKKM